MFVRDVEMFIEYCENKELAIKTIGSYEQTLRLLMLWLDEQGVTQTEKITHAVIQDYVKQIKERGKYWERYCYYQIDGGDLDLFLLAGPTIPDILILLYTKAPGACGISPWAPGAFSALDSSCGKLSASRVRRLHFVPHLFIIEAHAEFSAERTPTYDLCTPAAFLSMQKYL